MSVVIRTIQAAEQGHHRAQLALGIYVRRLRAAIAAMAAAMDGLDALIFTGGVGEHSPAIRAEACRGLRFLGVELDEQANQNVHADARINKPAASTPTLVVYSREDVTLAAEVRAVLAVATQART